MRADQFLVERGLAASRSQAQRLIAAGARWLSPTGWRDLSKSDDLPPGAEVELLDASEARYVSRGGLKLEGALRDTGLDVAGLHCLDVGQSTGGFTDCLLQHGAKKVYAVDVGYGQLAWKLVSDPRVVNRERVNVRYLSPADFDEQMDLAVIDLSFISLTKVLAPIRALLTPQADVVALVKPQFEVGKGDVGKGGIVKSPEKHQQAVAAVRACAESVGFAALGVTESPIKGAKGNTEFLMHLRVKRLEGETPQSLKETEARG